MESFNDSEPDEKLDDITRQVAHLFGAPIAMINLVNNSGVTFRSCVGQKRGGKLKHEEAFCSVAATQTLPLHIPDTLADPTYQNYALVTGPLKIRSYLGKSLRAPDGSIIGTLCVLDTKPRSYSKTQLKVLQIMAETAEQTLAEVFQLSPAPQY